MGLGYSQDELEGAQERFGLVFPPDLIALLRERRIPNGYDWTKDDERIREVLSWPLDGILFDVEKSGLWWPEWGERPLREEERAEVVTSVVTAAPKLIPLYSHRYLPERPHEMGNPVFSVSQSDIIYYGLDLADYLVHEFSGRRRCRRPLPDPTNRIEFWSDCVDRAGDNTYFPFLQVALANQFPPG